MAALAPPPPPPQVGGAATTRPLVSKRSWQPANPAAPELRHAVAHSAAQHHSASHHCDECPTTNCHPGSNEHCTALHFYTKVPVATTGRPGPPRRWGAHHAAPRCRTGPAARPATSSTAVGIHETHYVQPPRAALQRHCTHCTLAALHSSVDGLLEEAADGHRSSAEDQTTPHHAAPRRCAGSHTYERPDSSGPGRKLAWPMLACRLRPLPPLALPARTACPPGHDELRQQPLFSGADAICATRPAGLPSRSMQEPSQAACEPSSRTRKSKGTVRAMR